MAQPLSLLLMLTTGTGTGMPVHYPKHIGQRAKLLIKKGVFIAPFLITRQRDMGFTVYDHRIKLWARNIEREDMRFQLPSLKLRSEGSTGIVEDPVKMAFRLG